MKKSLFLLTVLLAFVSTEVRPFFGKFFLTGIALHFLTREEVVAPEGSKLEKKQYSSCVVDTLRLLQQRLFLARKRFNLGMRERLVSMEESLLKSKQELDKAEAALRQRMQISKSVLDQNKGKSLSLPESVQPKASSSK